MENVGSARALDLARDDLMNESEFVSNGRRQNEQI